jgi:CYTH domain-containing protein
MGKEIERKFLVSAIPPDIINQYQALSVHQGYITSDPAGQQVRVRSKGVDFFLTVKSKGQLERDEVEIKLSAEQFDALWPLTEGRRIEKKRYEVPYHEHTIEVDLFEGALSGLVVAEVEFASVEESQKLLLPEWFGEEVTEDARYTNSQMASSQKIPEQQ